MKKLISSLTFLFGLAVACPVFAFDPPKLKPTNELNNERINYGGQISLSEEEKKKLPQAFIIKKDANGEISVLTSKSLSQIDPANISDIENLPFKSLADVKGLKLENLRASTNELDNDKPRQSWYSYWHHDYYAYYRPVYYTPIYYFTYTYSYTYYPYYPYYAYNYGGCSYYWYRGW